MFADFKGADIFVDILEADIIADQIGLIYLLITGG